MAILTKEQRRERLILLRQLARLECFQGDEEIKVKASHNLVFNQIDIMVRRYWGKIIIIPFQFEGCPVKLQEFEYWRWRRHKNIIRGIQGEGFIMTKS